MIMTLFVPVDDQSQQDFVFRTEYTRLNGRKEMSRRPIVSSMHHSVAKRNIEMVKNSIWSFASSSNIELLKCVLIRIKRSWPLVTVIFTMISLFLLVFQQFFSITSIFYINDSIMIALIIPSYTLFIHYFLNFKLTIKQIDCNCFVT